MDITTNNNAAIVPSDTNPIPVSGTHDTTDTNTLDEDQLPKDSRPKWRIVLEQIGEIAKKVLFGALGIACFLTNPTVFAIGFIVGIVWDKKVEQIIDKVKLIVTKQKWPVLAGITAAALLSLQVTWATGCFAYGANIGSLLARKVRDSDKETTPQPSQPLPADGIRA